MARRKLIRGRNGAGDQADRQVVHEIAGERGDDAGLPSGARRRRDDRVVQQPAQAGDDAGVVERLHQHEQASHQRQHAP